MKVFNATIGVLAIFGALYCIFWPDESFLNVGWIVALITFLWGVCIIANHLIDRKYYQKTDRNIIFGIIGILFGLATCVVSVAATMNETIGEIFITLVLILLMIFLGLTGIGNMIDAIRVKLSKNPKGWIPEFIAGLVQFALVFVGLLHWTTKLGGDGFAEIIIGLLLGIFGITLIGSIFTKSKVDRWGEF